MFRRSSVRSFRTGFSKVTQLLSKELFPFLPDGESRKLVVFSDSREEAADLSNGIERSHYRDLVREATYDELRKFAVAESQLLADIELHGCPVSLEATRLAQSSPDELPKSPGYCAPPAAPFPPSTMRSKEKSFSEDLTMSGYLYKNGFVIMAEAGRSLSVGYLKV